MPNRGAADVRELPDREDPRVAHSVAAVRRAVAALLHEAPFSEITVQRILDRAGVGRATFYAHYRNKDDALLASFEGMVTGLEARMDVPPRRRGRLVPLEELLAHFDSARPVFTSLRDGGRLETIWGFGTDLLADLVERRARAAGAAGDELRLQARMLAGACVEMVRWWLERPAPPPAATMDARFHAMAWTVVRGR